MNCLLGCFGVKDYIKRKWHRFSRSLSRKKKELGVPRNNYASLGSYKEQGISSEKEDRVNIKENFDVDDGIHKETRQEAKFRKNCGPILDTHLEICKDSDQHYIVSNACHTNIKWEQQLGESSHHLLNEPESSTFSEEKSNSCQFEKLEETKSHGIEKEFGSGTLDVSPQTEKHIQVQVCESPYPTPLNLVDGMLTPGTILPTKPENFGTRVIRSQFVYAIPDDSQNMFKSEIVEDEDIENSGNQEASLLKPPIESNEEEISISFSSPDVEKPVAGTAVAHCDKEEQSQDSSKMYHGNGIPNSTTKYQEDQKVCWHATPFESRLERVLSEEKCHPQRNLDLEEAGIKARDFIRAHSEELLKMCEKMKNNRKLQQETTEKLSPKRGAENDAVSSQASST